MNYYTWNIVTTLEGEAALERNYGNISPECSIKERFSTYYLQKGYVLLTPDNRCMIVVTKKTWFWIIQSRKSILLKYGQYKIK